MVGLVRNGHFDASLGSIAMGVILSVFCIIARKLLLSYLYLEPLILLIPKDEWAELAKRVSVERTGLVASDRADCNPSRLLNS
jgi:hypothetical protein